jgi:hypothetical protein
VSRLIHASLLALVVAPAAAACRHPVQKQLEGRWMGDAVENFDDAVVPAATGWARGASFEFSGARMTVSVPAEEPRTGSYRIVKVRGADVTIEVDRTGGGVDRTVLRLDDERTLRWMLPHGRAVVMRREL